MSLWTEIRDFVTLRWLVPEQPQAATGTLLTKAASDEHIKVVYGRRTISGTIVFKNITNPNDNDDVKNDLLHLVIVWSEPVTCIEQIWLGDHPSQDARYNKVVSMAHFINGMSNYQDPHLLAAGWDPVAKKHQLTGLACSYVRLEWLIGEDNPWSGVPNIKATVLGGQVKKLIGVGKHASSNPAECLLDYLQNTRYGKGLADQYIDIDSFKRGARICNTPVPIHQDTTETKPLFTANIALDTSNRVLDNVNSLLKAMRATLPVINGKLTLLIEQDDPAVNKPITADMIRKTLKHSEGGKSSRFNRVIVEFDDAQKKFSAQQAVYPPPESELAKTWLAQDNGEVLEQSVKVNAITDYYEARQMARIIAMLSRESLNVEIEVCPLALQYTHGDVIPLFYEKLGFAGKPFRLVQSTMLADGWFKLTLREHQPHIYNWHNSNVRPPIPDSTLPSPTNVAPPTDLTFISVKDGGVLISWQSPYASFDFELYKNTRRIKLGTLAQPEYLINTLSKGDYSLDIRARSALGFSSPWVNIDFSVTLPEKPIISVHSRTVSAVTLSAHVQSAGLNTQFEWQFAGNGAQKNATGAQLTMAGLLPDTEYSGQCRTHNIAGKSPWQAFRVKTMALSASERVTGLVFELSQSPSWLSLGDTWQPATLEQNCAVVLNDAKSQTQLARHSFSVNLNGESGVLTAQLNDDATNDSGEPLLITFDGQGTPNLTATATHGLLVQRQLFSVTGVNLQDIKDIKADISEIDAIAESVLEQALDSEQVFDADLKSTLHLEQKTDTTNAVVSEAAAAQANENEAIATRINTVKSAVENSNAQIVEVSQTLANTEQALSTKITQLKSTVGENHSEIKTYFVTKVDSDSAISQAKNALTSEFNDNLASLDQTFYTKANTDEAIAAESTRLEASINGRLGAVSESINLVKSDVEGNNSALNTLTLRANSIDGSVWAVNNRVDAAQTDANNNSRAISALNLRAENIEKGVNANTSQISDVKTTAEGAAMATQNLTTRVRNSEGQISSANLTLQSHASSLGQLNARAALQVNADGRITGLDITPGKMKFDADSFEWHTLPWWSTSKIVIKAQNGGIVSYKDDWLKWSISSGGRFSGNSFEGYNIELGSETGYAAVAIRAYAGSTGAKVYGKFKAFEGRSRDWAFYAAEGEIGPHTSAHETLLPKELNPDVGDILCDDELMHIANISNAICTARLSSTSMDVTARGVYTRRRTLTDEKPAGLEGFEEWEQLAYLYDIASINAGGEGAMNVCGEGGNLQTGDLICSSSMLGKGMRQPTQSEERYTIAQVRHNVTFDSPDQVKMVAVIYKRG